MLDARKRCRSMEVSDKPELFIVYSREYEGYLAMINQKQANIFYPLRLHSACAAWSARALVVACGMYASAALAQVTPEPEYHDFSVPPIVAVLDYAKIIKIPEETRTVVLGNPSIADVTLSGKNRAIITAKGFGYTNFVLIDKNGEIISDRNIRVVKTSYKKVVIRKRSDLYTYICDPACEKTVELGDDSRHMRDAGGAIAMRASLARH